MDWEREFKGYETEVEPNKRDRAYSWMTAIGLQDVDRLLNTAVKRRNALRTPSGR